VDCHLYRRAVLGQPSFTFGVRPGFNLAIYALQVFQKDLSKAVGELVTRGRILPAVERYKKGEASLAKAAGLAGLPVGQRSLASKAESRTPTISQASIT